MEELFPLDDQYWSQRYQQHLTGWDLGGISPPLKAYIDQLENKDLHILIPGCGNAYEADYLWQQGFRHITLIDISEELTRHLQEHFSHTAIRIIHGNFFEHTGHYDLILEQTFFCAIHPTLREAYAQQMARLLNPGGKLAGLLFDCHFDGGPPFGGDAATYRSLLATSLHLQSLAPCYNSIAPRAGRELFLLATTRAAY
jgi:SAM-dependent methyltransferase